jgi:hypothetical protein
VFGDIPSIHFKYIYKFECASPTGAPIRQVNNIEFRYKNGKFYYDDKAEALVAPKGVYEQRMAYDGKVYQFLWDGTLSYSKNIQMIDAKRFNHVPIIQPFAFLYEHSDLREMALSAVSHFDLWKDAALRAELADVGNESVGDAVNETVHVKTAMGKEYTYHITLVPSLGFYPIKWTVNTEVGGKISMSVIKYKAVSWNNRQCIIPLQIELDTVSAEGKEIFHASTSVDESSVEIGRDVPDELFVIPSTIAVQVKDADRNVYLKAEDVKASDR